MNAAKLMQMAKYRLEHDRAIAAGDFKVYDMKKRMWRTLPIPEGYTARKASEVITAAGKALAQERPAVRWIIESIAE